MKDVHSELRDATIFVLVWSLFFYRKRRGSKGSWSPFTTNGVVLFEPKNAELRADWGNYVTMNCIYDCWSTSGIIIIIDNLHDLYTNVIAFNVTWSRKAEYAARMQETRSTFDALDWKCHVKRPLTYSGCCCLGLFGGWGPHWNDS
jgi:hypothetical protein